MGTRLKTDLRLQAIMIHGIKNVLALSVIYVHSKLSHERCDTSLHII